MPICFVKEAEDCLGKIRQSHVGQGRSWHSESTGPLCFLYSIVRGDGPRGKDSVASGCLAFASLSRE